MKTRVMLINSPTMGDQRIGTDNYFPMGLLYMGGTLKSHNVAVEVIDINNYYYPNGKADLGWMQTEKQRIKNIPFVDEDMLHEYFEDILQPKIKDFKPDIIGMGAIFSGAFRGLRTIGQQIKDTFPNVTLIIGGITSTMFAQDILRKYDYIDYAAIGESEDTLLKFVQAFENNTSMKNIGGFAFRDGSEIKRNEKTEYLQDLDALPFPDYSILDVSEYNMDTSGWYSPKGIKIGQPYSILSSRSCPRQCTFCNMFLVHGNGIRYRSPENVLDEMEFLYNEYGVRYFQFMDDNLTYDKNRMLEICDGILKRNLNIQFDTPNGVAAFRLDEHVIDAMVDAGLVQICIAIESGSEYIRNKVMKKGLKNDKVYEIVEACAKHTHLMIKGYFIIGMPEETYDTMEETYTMIQNLSLDKIGVFFATAYPGTELFRYCAQHNLLEYNVKEMVDIVDLQHEADRPHFKPFEVSKEDLIVFQKKCHAYQNENRQALVPHLPDNYPLRYVGYNPEDYHLRYRGITAPRYKQYKHMIRDASYGSYDFKLA